MISALIAGLVFTCNAVILAMELAYHASPPNIGLCVGGTAAMFSLFLITLAELARS